MFEQLNLEQLHAQSEVFRANIRFLSRFRLGTIFHRLIDDIERERHIMTDFATDETRLEADVATETALVGQVQTATTANATEVSTLKAEIETLKGQGVDTTKMESALTALEANNTKLAEAVPSGATQP